MKQHLRKYKKNENNYTLILKNMSNFCSCCREVTHPTCHTDYGVEGQISEITPNSWFCPKCMKFNPPSEEELAAKLRKVEEPEFVVHGKSNQPKCELRAQLADKILAASKKPVKAPQFVYRPPPLEDNVEDVSVLN